MVKIHRQKSKLCVGYFATFKREGKMTHMYMFVYQARVHENKFH